MIISILEIFKGWIEVVEGKYKILKSSKRWMEKRSFFRFLKRLISIEYTMLNVSFCITDVENTKILKVNQIRLVLK